jgi:hypothetical protein
MKTKEEIQQRLERVKECIKVHEQHGVPELWDEYKELKQERKQLKQQLKDLPSLEVGKWYKDPNTLGYIYFITKTTTTEISGYGIIGNEWNDDFGLLNSAVEFDIPATDTEVEEALIKEARKRGFKEGVRFNNAVKDSVWEASSGVVSTINSNDWGLFTNNQYIFCKGKWAEIIKPKTVNLNGDYTEVQLKDVLNSQFNK